MKDMLQAAYEAHKSEVQPFTSMLFNSLPWANARIASVGERFAFINDYSFVQATTHPITFISEHLYMSPESISSSDVPPGFAEKPFFHTPLDRILRTEKEAFTLIAFDDSIVDYIKSTSEFCIPFLSGYLVMSPKNFTYLLFRSNDSLKKLDFSGHMENIAEICRRN